MTAASFLVIMFSTRLGFDVFSHSYETRSALNLLFIFIYNFGVILMAFFIEMKPAGHQTTTAQCLNDELFNLGGCYQSAANSSGFAAGFLVTRAIIMLIFGYLYVLISMTETSNHEPNEVDEALRRSCRQPNDLLVKSLNNSRIAQEFDKNPSEKLIYTRGVAVGYQLGLRHKAAGKVYLKYLDGDRFESIYYIIIYVISSVVVGAGFDFNFRQPYWLLIAAIVESLGGLLKDQLKVWWGKWKGQPKVEKGQPNDEDQDHTGKVGDVEETNEKLQAKIERQSKIEAALKELYERTASFYQSRLFSFYILVLGEAVLGLVIIPVVSAQEGFVTGVIDLGCAYCIIFSLGFQYSYFVTASTEKHAMETFDGYVVRNWYIWFHVIAAYAILMASNSTEHIFEDTQQESCDPSEVHAEEEYANTLKLGVGLVAVWLCFGFLQRFHKKMDWNEMLIIILAITAHSIGSIPGLIHQKYLLAYHAVVVCFIVIIEIAMVTLQKRSQTNPTKEENSEVELTNPIAPADRFAVRSSFESSFDRSYSLNNHPEKVENLRYHTIPEEREQTKLDSWVYCDPKIKNFVDFQSNDESKHSAERSSVPRGRQHSVNSVSTATME